ncbi:hypothetical protein R6Q59_024386 [Mikania micrantha]|uniref:Late embryogenesis abundant protein LEA-2 subgroup domain-containing protein n=1 Tax=Mikania micrantha TaxID=192012 RepID=A0A5N6P4V7_9ASTR|nr:hypothetical protein E3N88_14736 [Mikania micrantha]
MANNSDPDQQESQRQSIFEFRRSILIKIIIIIVLALIVLIGLALLVKIGLHLAIRQVTKLKRPIYYISGGSINNYILTKDHHLYASYNLVLESFNPNKMMPILYKKMEIKIMYENVELASGVIDAWRQHKREKREFKLDLVSHNVVLSEAVSGHLKLAKSLDQVVLDLELKSKIKYKIIGLLNSRYYHMKVSCVNVVSQFSNSSKGSHGSCNTFL